MYECSYTKCKGQDLRYVQGELTCISCGTVQEGYNMVDMICQRDVALLLDYEQPKIKRETEDKLLKHFRDILANKIMCDELFLEHCCSWYDVAKLHKGVKCIKPNYIFSACFYCVSVFLKRGYDLNTCYFYFKIKTRKFWKCLENVIEAWKGKNWYATVRKHLSSGAEQIKRTVYQVDIISLEDQWDIIRIAGKLHEKVSMYPGLMTVKSRTLQACCIYIACNIQKLEIKKDEFCKNFNISMASIIFYENIIQDALINAKTRSIVQV